MSPVVLIIVHLVAAAWFAWSVGMLLRLRRENAELAASLEAMRNRRFHRMIGERGRGASVFHDVEGRN